MSIFSALEFSSFFGNPIQEGGLNSIQLSIVAS